MPETPLVDLCEVTMAGKLGGWITASPSGQPDDIFSLAVGRGDCERNFHQIPGSLRVRARPLKGDVRGDR
jgi:hypothetical protein